MKRVLSAFLFILLLIFLFPLRVYANDATLGGTGITVYPIIDANVVMEKEIIDISIRNGRSYVKCQFFFTIREKRQFFSSVFRR